MIYWTYKCCFNLLFGKKLNMNVIDEYIVIAGMSGTSLLQMLQVTDAMNRALSCNMVLSYLRRN